MNNLLKRPIGIDTDIQSIQQDIFNFLSTRWKGELSGYGRIFKNKDENDGTIYPQWRTEGGEYKKDVYHDDKYSGAFSFIDSDLSPSEDGFVYVSDVKCVFMLNLTKVLPSSEDRADSEAQRDVVEILRELAPGKFSIIEIQKGISNVYSGFNQDKIKDLDIQPYHCFSVNIKLSYNINDKCE